MGRGVAVALTVVAGSLVAMQAPINSRLGKTVGTFSAASVSFAIGLAVLVAITLVVGEGFGRVSQARHLQWYYLLGGVLGAAYVSTVLVSVRTLGAGGVTAATIAGQLAMAEALDRLGILGLPQRGLTLPRVVGVALLAAGVFLVVRD
ncbi:MAG TPA: DMT family transporter [Thermoleophilaceae bacterium]|nr:DMT family transporter [Thermoleophilaceae bacterium]